MEKEPGDWIILGGFYMLLFCWLWWTLGYVDLDSSLVFQF